MKKNKKIENTIKSQLKLSKITDSKKVNLKVQKTIKVPDNIAKFLNLLPNPSNWWRAITKWIIIYLQKFLYLFGFLVFYLFWLH